MTENKIGETCQGLIYLASCALHGTKPEEAVVAEIDLQQLYRLCRAHSLTAIVCMALEGTATFAAASPELQKKWLDEKNKAIRKNILLDAERAKLFAWMDEQGIRYMPLKGSVLKDMYPKMGMRQMADNDILYDAAFQQTVKDHMVAQGYKAVSVGSGNHDEYEKPPVYNFELHRALFGAIHNPLWENYYADVEERLLKDEGNSCGYHFRDEDFYVYMILHAYKHYEGCGTGFRLLLDVYVYIQQKESVLDWLYVDQETGKLEIIQFEQQCRTLAKKLFLTPDPAFYQTLTEEEQSMLIYLADAGSYGNMSNKVQNSLEKMQPDGEPIQKNVKRQYLIRRLFPDLSWFRMYVPFCYQHRWAIPFYMVYRMFRGALKRPRQILREVRLVRKAGNQ
jgi:hypothetical protein